LSKIEDFGVHCKQYYQLDVTYFKSALDRKLLDSLWNKYWMNTLGSSGLLSNPDYTTRQILDLSEKLELSEASLGRGQFMASGSLDPNEKRTEDKLSKASRDCSRASIELIHGLMAQISKHKLFNTINTGEAKGAENTA